MIFQMNTARLFFFQNVSFYSVLLFISKTHKNNSSVKFIVYIPIVQNNKLHNDACI